MGNSTSSQSSIDERVNCGVNTMGREVVLVYDMPQGAGSPSFGFIPVPGGYQARFRASSTFGYVYGHDSGTIPASVFRNLGRPSGGRSGGSYRVTMTSGGST